MLVTKKMSLLYAIVCVCVCGAKKVVGWDLETSVLPICQVGGFDLAEGASSCFLGAKLTQVLLVCA